MRKIISFIAVLALTMPMLTNCSSDDTADEPKNNEEQVEEKTVYNAVYVASDDKMAFIALRSDGSAEYCLDKYSMGYGKYEIINDMLTISNEYTGYNDELEITSNEDGSIRLKGHIRRLNTTEYSYVDMTLSKSAEAITFTWQGKEFVYKGMHNRNGLVDAYYTFNTDHEGGWATYLQATGGLVDKKAYHYVSRTLIDTDKNGNTRTRKIAYCHNDVKTEDSELYAVCEDYYDDISLW